MAHLHDGHAGVIVVDKRVGSLLKDRLWQAAGASGEVVNSFRGGVDH